MNRRVLGMALASAVMVAPALIAQTPQNPQTPRTPQAPARPSTTATQPSDAGRMVTVEGCVTREANVPGRKPNVAERAGIAEDYILTSTKMVKGSAPAGMRSGTTGTTGATGTTGTGTAGTTGAAGAGMASGPMYKIEGVDDQRLQALVGKRVQIDGSFDNLDAAREPGNEELVEIDATMVREVAGTCTPAK